MTIREFKPWAIKQLTDISDSPATEADLLLTWALNQSVAYIYAHPETALKKAQQNQLNLALQRRTRREPLAYITGYNQFRGQNYTVNKSTLIPRPETEELVELALEQLESAKYRQVLDIGTGSGCIAISLALEAGTATQVTAIEPGPALKVARKNADHLQAKVNFVSSAIADFRPEQRFELIVANPPYITEAEMQALQPEVQFEPRSALAAGPDGQAVYRQIAEAARNYAADGSLFLLELHSSTATETAAVFAAVKGFKNIEILPDLSGRKRFLRASFTRAHQQ